MSNSKINLSEKQMQIASHKDGALLVLASAGSGKTRVLTERIKQLVSITKRKILAITFTNEASEEIKDRLQDSIDVNECLFVGTFHAFCIHVLENHGSALGYDEVPQIFSNSDDRLKIIEAAILNTPSVKVDYESSDTKKRNLIKSNILEGIAKIKREVILDSELENYHFDSTTILLYRTYQKLMASLNAIDFDDLLLITYELFINNPKIAALYRRNFEYICVDEAQDMNKAQYMVLRALTGTEHKNIMLVGDPKQAIYGFNGSDSRYMTERFKEDYNPKEITLNENYRSSRKVLELANEIVPDPSSLDNIVIEGICEINEFASVEDETDWVISTIQELLSIQELPDIEGDINVDKIAILARNKYVLLPIENKLRELKYDVYYKSSSSEVIFDSDIMKFFNLGLQVRINHKDRLHLTQLQSKVKLKGYKTLEDLKNAKFPAEEYHDIILLLLDLENDGSNFKNKIKQLIDKANSKANYVDMNENERALMCNDLQELSKHWRRYISNTSSISIASFRNAMALGQTRQGQDNHGIALSTVHTMKGQENDIVFLIGMDNETFPDYRAIAKGGVEMEQEKNNLYVAVTRARRYLYVTYPISRLMPWGDSKKRIKSTLLP